MDYMIYPTLEIVEQRGLIPSVHLPQNYEGLVQNFYREGRKEEVDKYAENLEKLIKGTSLETEIDLQWDDRLGLRNISVGPSGGFDLNASGWPSFQEHNLGTKTSFVAASIAMKYISELLKSE